MRERDDFIDFLWKDEGLRASRELMAGWVDHAPTYHPEHANVMVGPLKPALDRATSRPSPSGSTPTSSACCSTAPTTTTRGASPTR